MRLSTGATEHHPLAHRGDGSCGGWWLADVLKRNVNDGFENGGGVLDAIE